jgi:serine/arginine repetitive matrix protein 2
MGSVEQLDNLESYNSATYHHYCYVPVRQAILDNERPSEQVVHRFATIRARELFLTTYYDPFYPDLHLYTTKPDTLRHSVMSSMVRSPSWSVFSLSHSFQRYGWRAVAEQIWDRFCLFICDCQRQAWEAWGAEDQLSGTSWPPT